MIDAQSSAFWLGTSGLMTLIIGSLTVLVAAITVIKAIVEYTRQNALKRFEKFQEMRRRFKDDEEMKIVCAFLENDNVELRTLDFELKRDFLGFFEEIALMHNSKIIKTEVAHYMFGYYALRCDESENFWYGVNKDSFYWSLFNNFSAKMRKLETDAHSQKPDLSRFRF